MEAETDLQLNQPQEGNERESGSFLAFAEYLVEFSAPHELNNRIPLTPVCGDLGQRCSSLTRQCADMKMFL